MNNNFEKKKLVHLDVLSFKTCPGEIAFQNKVQPCQYMQDLNMFKIVIISVFLIIDLQVLVCKIVCWLVLLFQVYLKRD